MKNLFKSSLVLLVPLLAMYLAKLCEIIFAKVPIPVLILGFLIIIYKILKEVIL